MTTSIDELGLSQQQLQEFKDAFALFDQDGDGKITKEELGNVLTNIGYPPTKEDLDDMLKEVDIDGNGTIEFQEFVILMSQKMSTKDTDAEIREAFAVFDKNNDGFISSEELKSVMKSLGDDLTDEQIREMIKEADLDGDGLINYEEFLTIMKK